MFDNVAPFGSFVEVWPAYADDIVPAYRNGPYSSGGKNGQVIRFAKVHPKGKGVAYKKLPPANERWKLDNENVRFYEEMKSARTFYITIPPTFVL